MNKTIWFFWWQGIETAPPLVLQCLKSWQLLNPGWDVRFISKANYLDLNLSLPRYGLPDSVPIQAFSDILRIHLLQSHGGVWVDASVLCRTPLDAWLHDLMNSGFFAFHRPGKDRSLSSWFLAATPENYLVNHWANLTHQFWSCCPRRPLGTSTRDKAVGQLFMKAPYLLANKITSRMEKKYPYFWFHYLFRALCASDPTAARRWKQTPKITANLPHRLQTIGLERKIDETFCAWWEHSPSPVYKLNWRMAYPSQSGDSILDYVMNEEHWRSNVPPICKQEMA